MRRTAALGCGCFFVAGARASGVKKWLVAGGGGLGRRDAAPSRKPFLTLEALGVPLRGKRWLYVSGGEGLDLVAGEMDGCHAHGR